MSGEIDEAPTLFDLFEWVRSTPGLNAAAREAILDRLGGLLLALGRTAAWRVAWNPADLARYSIDFELVGTSERAKQILIESTLVTLFHQEVERGVVNGPLKLVIALDDAQRYFAGGETTGDLAPRDELAGVIRGTGLSLWADLQSLTGLPTRLPPNLTLKLMGRLGSAVDYTALGAHLSLRGAQLDWAQRHLVPGTFVGQVGEGDWREPFVFTVPLLKLAAPVDDSEVAVSVKALDALPTVPAPEFFHWELHPRVTVAGEPDLGLSDVERDYLKAVLAAPGQPSSFYSRSLRLSGRRAAVIRDRLIQAGLLRQHTVATRARGRSALVLEPLEAAARAVAAPERTDTP